MSWDLLRRGLAVALVAGAVGCATEREDALRRARPLPVEGEGEPSSGGMELLWSVEDVRFVSIPQEARAEGRRSVITIGVAEEELVLLAHDPESGEELWRRPTTASYLTAGVWLFPVVDRDRVFHVVESVGGDGIEAVDAGSGEVVWSTDESARGFSDPLSPCPGSASSLCITESGGGIWEIDIDTGDVTEAADPIVELTGLGRPAQQEVGGRHLGQGLYELDSGDIARVEDGEILWQRSPSELFGGADVTPDFGWRFAAADDLIVGYLSPNLDIIDDGEIPIPAAQMAGIDPDTGDAVWLEPGEPFCGGRLRRYAPPWIRCEETGAMLVEDERIVGWVIETSSIEGFDPQTGEATWSADMGAASALWNDDGVVVRIDDTTFALHRDDGSLLVVDLSDGSAPVVAPDAVGWCFRPNNYDIDGQARTGADFMAPCNLDGERQVVPASADDLVGLTIDGVFVWMDEAGLHGAR